MKALSKRFGALFLGLAIILSWSLPANAFNFIMKDLGVLPGGTFSVATAINNSGQVTGYGDTLVGSEFQTHAFLYANGVMTDLGTVAGWKHGKAFAINNSGQIVGQGSPDLNYYHSYPILYSGGVWTHLAPPPALASGSVAYGINNAGQIVGYGNWINGDWHNDHAFLYNDPAVLDLGTLGGTYSEAHGINNSGLIVGWAYNDKVEKWAFRYDGQMINIGGLGGEQADFRSSASAINDAGLIVGEAIAPDMNRHAFLYDGAMHDLGTNGQTESSAKGINSAGWIVGWYGYGIYGRGFVYINGKMQDLGDLAANPESFNTFANGINDWGWIVGESKTKTGDRHAFLAVPSNATVPSFLLLLLD